MENKKNTAIEELVKKMCLKDVCKYSVQLAEAKENEKKQIIDAYDNGKHLFYDSQDYFKKTFNKNKNE